MKYFELHPYMGAFFAFFVAFIESLPIIGTIFPGSITMTAIGTLIGAGIIPASITMLLACTGAFMGDCLGYLAGRVYQDQIKACWPFSKYEKWLIKSEVFFKRHGGKSVIIGRFFGPIRSTVPLVAGLLKLSWPRFIFAAIPSAIMWAIFYMAPGILLGALSVELPAKQTTEFILIGVCIIIGLWFLFWVIEHSFKYLSKIFRQCSQTAWNHIQPGSRLSGLKKALQVPHNPSDATPMALLAGSVLFLLLFIMLRVIITLPHQPLPINQILYTLLQSFHTPSMTLFFTAMALIGAPLTVLILTLLASTFFYWKKQRRTALFLLTSIIATAVLVTLLKHLLPIPRPPATLSFKTTSSFPSAHALLSLVYYFLLAYVCAHSLAKKSRWIPYTLASLLVTFIALSRLYLGAHWLTDILGSVLLGTCILFTTVLFFRRKTHSLLQLKAKDHSILFSIILIALFIIIPHRQDTLIKHYQQHPRSTQASQPQWWSNPLSVAPTVRYNRLGKPFLPFNIQWASNLSSIKQQLTADQWKELSPKSLIKKTIQPLLGTDPQYRQPIFTWLYQYQAPALTMIKKMQKQHTLLEIRLWQSYITFTDSHEPLWIGTINYHGASHKLIPIRAINRSSYSLKKAPEEIDIDNTLFETKSIQLTSTEIQHLPLNTQWDHTILLIRKKQDSPTTKQ